MNTIKIDCPFCGLNIEYWTLNNYINCIRCRREIVVEPCKIEEEQEVETEEE